MVITFKQYANDEIIEIEKKQMKPKVSQVDRAHGLPKIHKEVYKFSSVQPIIDTTNTPQYNFGKLLTRLLNPLTQNVHSIKDSLEALDRI